MGLSYVVQRINMTSMWRKFFIIYGTLLFLAVVVHLVKYQEEYVSIWEYTVAVTSVFMIVGGLEDER